MGRFSGSHTGTLAVSDLKRDGQYLHRGQRRAGRRGVCAVGPGEITDCRFSGNTATGAGGALCDDGNATVTGTNFTAGSTVAGNDPDNCAPPGAISGCATLAVIRNATGLPGDRGRPAEWRSAQGRSAPSHHGGHLPPLLLRELTGR